MKKDRKPGKGLVLTINPDAVPDGLKRQFTKAYTEALKAAAAVWRTTMLPKHFTSAGAALYDYAKRQPKYLAAKRRAKGHEDPLVYTGALKNLMLGQTPKVTAGSSGIKMKFDGLPEYLYQRARVTESVMEGALAATGGDIKAVAKLLGLKKTRVVDSAAEWQLVRARRKAIVAAWEKLGRDVDKTAGALKISKVAVGLALSRSKELERFTLPVNKGRELMEMTPSEIAQLKQVVSREVKARAYTKKFLVASG